ncbi:MAG: hypothetical protein WCA35_01215, partial [Kovacikia sp.]
QESRRPSGTEVILATTAATLGLLSHGGVIFTLPAFALLFVRPQTLPGIRSILVGCAVFGLLIAPWTAYQKFYNPPGNRLVKWHIAGVADVDSRSSWQAISDSYHSLSIGQIASHKWENFKVIFDSQVPQKNQELSPYRMREEEFFYLFKAVGILNGAWLVLMLVPLARWLPPLNNFFNFSLNQFKGVRMILGVALVSLLVWVLLMFGPATTILHQGSYATLLLLFTGLAGLIAGLSRFLAYFVLSLQILSFAAIWIFTLPPIVPDALAPILNIGMIAAAIAALIGMITVLNCLSQQELTQVEP